MPGPGVLHAGLLRLESRAVSRRDLADAHLINAALDIHRDDPAFGHRFIADELPSRGITARGEPGVARLCTQQRIRSVFAKKKGLTRRAGPPVHDDLVQKVFAADAANQLWTFTPAGSSATRSTHG